MTITLRNPFDDPVFAALATAAGHNRDDVPEEYDPGLIWGNSAPTIELENMPDFDFLVGDGAYPGLLTIDIDWDTSYTRTGDARLDVEGTFPDTIMAAAAGKSLGDVIALPGHQRLAVRTMALHPDGDGRTTIALDDVPDAC